MFGVMLDLQFSLESYKGFLAVSNSYLLSNWQSLQNQNISFTGLNCFNRITEGFSQENNIYWIQFSLLQITVYAVTFRYDTMNENVGFDI